MHPAAIPFLTALVVAQSPTPPPLATDLEALARRIDAAHRPRGPVPAVTALRCTMELHGLDSKAEQGGQVDVTVRFMEWKRPGREKVQSLIRYEVQQAGAPIVRGRDVNGPWHLFQGEPRDLRNAEFTEDLKNCERDTNLARQLIRFFDPGAVLRSLQNPSAVREEILQLDRNTRVPCSVVEGDLLAFPLLQQGGEDAPVRLTIFVRKAEGTLLAIEAWPLVDGKKDETRGERVHLLDLHERDDLLVPRELVHLFRGPDGQLHLKSRAVLTTLSLRPELRAEDFDRKKN